MMSLARSRALWNRQDAAVLTDEVLAQVLDRGEMDTWRDLYALAAGDPALRRRIVALVRRVPLPLPRFWLAAMASLGEEVDLGWPLPEYGLAET